MKKQMILMRTSWRNDLSEGVAFSSLVMLSFPSVTCTLIVSDRLRLYILVAFQVFLVYQRFVRSPMTEDSANQVVHCV